MKNKRAASPFSLLLKLRSGSLRPTCVKRLVMRLCLDLCCAINFEGFRIVYVMVKRSENSTLRDRLVIFIHVVSALINIL